MSEAEKQRNTCHCCEGIRALTPIEYVNRPGLSGLVYRVGTHGSFKATMFAKISTAPALRALGTREDDDFTIALMDAWATVADVLSFYTERVANEGFMRSATERHSIQELARSIGYEPQPGVAASTYLAFTVEDAPGSAKDVPIPRGTRAQSSPDGDEMPQTFETIKELLAHPEWNDLRPRQTEDQVFDQESREFYFEGTNTQLKAGDWMLLRVGENSDPDNPGAIRNIPLQVVRVEPNEEQQHTRVELVRTQVEQTGTGGPVLDLHEAAPSPSPPPSPPPAIFTNRYTLSGENVTALTREFAWSTDDIVLFEEMNFYPSGQVARYVNNTVADLAPAEGTVVADPEPSEAPAIFAMRVESAPFGHNAPRWETLPFEWRFSPNDSPDPVYGNPWDGQDSWPIDTGGHDGLTRPYKAIYGNDPDQNEDIILLDAIFSEVLPASWIILKGSGEIERVTTFQVTKAEQVSRADFALNANVTALTLESQQHEETAISGFRLRTTTIYAQSEVMTLAGKPIDDPVQGDTIELDRRMENQIHPGQPIIVSGTPIGLKDIVESELTIVIEAVQFPRYTRLVFEKKLQRRYRRDSVRLNANTVPATHGESQKEVLGDGNASQPFQSFQLSHPFLTYVSAPVPGGAASTLELRVNGVLWHEASHLFGLGPNDRRYVLRRDDEGKTTVAFGDGRLGGRLPTGFGNVVANFRSGLGLAGNLLQDKITLLGSQPRYVQGVNNPLPATGGADPESSTAIRRNAPNSVRTFGRIVSLQDYEDFAGAFAGVSKARANLLQVAAARVVHVTIAGEHGAAITTDSALYLDLVEAMNRVRDPFQHLIVASYEPRFFDVVTKVGVHADYQREMVFASLKESLRETFSFDRRALAQSITLSEVIATMQRVQGVVAIDLDRMRFSHEKDLQVFNSGGREGSPRRETIIGEKVPIKQRRLKKIPSRLLALRARLNNAGRILSAQHLRIRRIHLLELS